MFKLFREIFRVFYGAQMGFVVLLAAVFFPAIAVLNLVMLLWQRKYSELGQAYILVIAAIAMVAFVIWVHRDATSTGERLERRRRKKVAVEPKVEEPVKDNDDIIMPPSDQIRPAPGGT